MSKNAYVVLPTKAAPKVYLPVNNRENVSIGFDLYNPFSTRAKFLKCITLFIMKNLPFIGRVVFPVIYNEQSVFSNYIDKTLKSKFTIASYIATAKDKVVLQLQDQNGIYGYLKYPISELGKKRLINERNAIIALSKKGIVMPLKFEDQFEGMPFFILEELSGEIEDVSKVEYCQVLNRFKKDISFSLIHHPRIINMKERLKQLSLKEYKVLLDAVCLQSKLEYHEVYEHGDFAPWNLIKTTKGIVPFDFEFFEADGLEYLDELKLLYQVGALLKRLKGDELMTYINDESQIEEFDILFQIFLIKEIINKSETLESIANEVELLKLMGTHGRA